MVEPRQGERPVAGTGARRAKSVSVTVPANGPEPQPASESDDARRNRQLTELLNELRVALPGVQMLFGFLLAVPFSQRFTHVTSHQQALYYTAFVTAAAASVCFIAPTSFHRIVWRHGDKGLLLRISSGLTIVGTVFLAVAIISVMLFITSYLYGSSYAAVIGSLLLGMLVVLWYVLPLAVRLRLVE
jgi:Flp pilus assembly protein TadB